MKISSVKFSDYFLECMELIDYKYRTFYLDLSLWRLLGDRSLYNTRGDEILSKIPIDTIEYKSISESKRVTLLIVSDYGLS